ncbi:hypothetical protein EDD28_1354 [Salana multivorans]|uniref:Pyridoxal phosphate homeostasis protein n=1 Tax=Salana multivorans TaxID=120377 RepID=A0A3N2DAJ8_9MICO|nr:YggS family pyridoxal phosphate-dependent enzyme [Salana multivorans]MBN8881664.1 YggS family pyridoxal phosphate-dependent enzyme [Salana multivorans]OJX96929.1 MAG: YggS family pyridoxal phosphate enzyme [Micrococcales bacterium 73-15]ROR96763.1 hypothetical protein EDD28_1354 [Salana multivorans]
MNDRGSADTVADRLAVVRRRITRASRAAGRDPSEIRMLAVSKTVPAEVVESALDLGCRDLGESRAQELTVKAEALAERGPRWVFIGPVQTNKAREVARYAHEVQSLDRVELADALQRRLDQAGRILDVLVQVNTSAEASKSGVAPDAALDLVREVARRDRLRVRGLMTIGTRGGDEAETRRCFRELVRVRELVRDAVIDGVVLDELSMGMSGDLELAIAEGSTTVRVGSALFGAR